MNYVNCYHCLKAGHWRDGCPLLALPEDKDHHEARIATAKWRFGDGEIGLTDKRRIIETENKLWKQRQKELASK